MSEIQEADNRRTLDVQRAEEQNCLKIKNLTEDVHWLLNGMQQQENLKNQEESAKRRTLIAQRLRSTAVW